MATHMILFFNCCLLAWIVLNGFITSSTEGVEAENTVDQTLPLSRRSFPDEFLFGTGSAAYQIEGASQEDGRGDCIWDIFAKEHPEKIADGGNGSVAADFYHRFREDIRVMKTMGLDSFRFSISWSRIFPKGTISGGVNYLGVKFYNNLINELLCNGIQPFVTLLHFDTPQALEDEYGGLLNRTIVKDFKHYADFCFRTFGDRVKLWVTMNEPNLWSLHGYNDGVLAPGRCSNYVGNCPAGDSATEPYRVAHHLLLAHAAAVKLYKDKYQARQNGQIGITLMTHWFEPKFRTPADYNASFRALDFLFGWFAHPVIYGDYPQSMKLSVGDRLPKFSPDQSKLLEGSLDFLGLNYYTAYYVEPAPSCNATLTTGKRRAISEMQPELLKESIDFLGLNTADYAEPAPLSSDCNASYEEDRAVKVTMKRHGKAIGTPTDVDWLFIYPQGLLDVLQHIKDNYKNPPLVVTENGYADASDRTYWDTVKDSMKITYLEGHLTKLLRAIREGVNVKGYYIWSHLDVFEWRSGYTIRFGLIFVDYKNQLTRHVKDSARWFQKFLLK